MLPVDLKGLQASLDRFLRL